MVVVIVFGIGAIVGAVVHRLFNSSSKNTAQLKDRLEQVEDELKTYKASVNSHFSKTSDLVSELTQDYVKVYKHLAEGAQKLGDPKEFTSVLEQQQEGKVLISFADEVVPEAENDTDATTTGNEPIAPEEVKTEEAVQQESAAGGETITPKSQEQLSETIKEVAEKVKGTESPMEPKAATTTTDPAADERPLQSENDPPVKDSENAEAAERIDKKLESELRTQRAAEATSSTQTQPQNNKP